MDEQQWQYVGELASVTQDEPLGVEVGGIPVGVFRLDDAVHAIENTCPHADALLSQGFVDGDHVECPLHGAMFHIPSGRCTKGPAQRDVAIFETRTEAGKIYVRKAAA